VSFAKLLERLANGHAGYLPKHTRTMHVCIRNFTQTHAHPDIQARMYTHILAHHMSAALPLLCNVPRGAGG